MFDPIAHDRAFGRFSAGRLLGVKVRRELVAGGRESSSLRPTVFIIDEKIGRLPNPLRQLIFDGRF
jgi:hypothetical protein